jgi:hypothetical protein
MVQVQIDGREALDEDFTEYPTVAQRMIVRSLNRGIAAANTVMTRAIAQDIGLKAMDVRAAIKLDQASINRPEARLNATLKRIPLIKFGARGPEPSRGKGRGVTYRLPGGRGRLEHAFITTATGGHRSGQRGVYMRIGREREPIKEKYGPSIGHVFAKFRPLGLARAYEAFASNLTHELDRTRKAHAAD